MITYFQLNQCNRDVVEMSQLKVPTTEFNTR